MSIVLKRRKKGQEQLIFLKKTKILFIIRYK